MINDGHNHCDLSEKMQRYQDYIQALEKERCKIQVFQRELPLCLELVTQAIKTCKQQLSGTRSEYNSNGGQNEFSEETSSDVPVLEEFMPIKRDSPHSDEEQKSKKTNNDTNKEGKINGNYKNSKKSDWLRSVQLWNQTPDPPSNYKQDSPRKVAVTEVKKTGCGGAFHPFKKLEKNVCGGETSTDAAPPPDRTVPPASTSSTAETGGSSGTARNKQEKDGQSQRKSRRCWSPELHRRFLQALQQLGGSHAATPKQIRELMKVDGLTNDEVKSHLQKYRLHTRRPSPSIHPTTTTNAQAPQFLVVGGIWVPPEYATMAAPATTTTSREPSSVAQSNGIYAPIATLPPPFQGASKQRQQHQSSNSDDRGSHIEGHVQSHSPATSSSRRN